MGSNKRNKRRDDSSPFKRQQDLTTKSLFQTENLITKLLNLVDDTQLWAPERNLNELYENLKKVDEVIEKIKKAQGGLIDSFDVGGREFYEGRREEKDFERFWKWLEDGGCCFGEEGEGNSDYGIRFVDDSAEREGREQDGTTNGTEKDSDIARKSKNNFDTNSDNATLFARTNIKADQLLMKIPSTLFFPPLPSSTPQSPLEPLFASHPIFAQAPSITLSLSLLSSLYNPCHPHQPYFQILPRHFTLPILTTPKTNILALYPSPSYQRALKLFRNHCRHYGNLWNMLKKFLNSSRNKEWGLEKFTWVGFEWAISVIMTRQNQIEDMKRSLGGKLALVPLWDMCNHEEGSFQKMTTSFVTERADDGEKEVGFVECRAMRDYRSGENITIFYGNRPNEELLLFSGFVSQNNVFDSVKIPICCRKGFEKDTGLIKLKIKLLQNNGVELVKQPRGNATTANDENEKNGVEEQQKDDTLICEGRVRYPSNIENLCQIAYLLFSTKTELLSIMRTGLYETRPNNSVIQKEAFELVGESLHTMRDRYIQAKEDNSLVIHTGKIEIERSRCVKDLHQVELQLINAAIGELEQRRTALKNKIDE